MSFAVEKINLVLPKFHNVQRYLVHAKILLSHRIII